ncbi:Spy/CpxP family protein refolding chaperone [Dyella tabacisoli]|uniref:Periplasmic heavy metal sensor n=1 Tax=Dyella tabacisoli TaxID=2282381 RepID=A0A369US84_9GAMM|nr:Spy/CpxP family protein refolding chaperone [Dyella tabacisoli]RDD83381.1 hypothetical protein DVJ77_02015 [Dyella tabacisoli]
MRKIIPLSILLTTALACSALAFAAPDGEHFGGQGHGHGHGGEGFRELQKLNLSDAQRASIKDIVKQGFAQLKPQMQAVRQQRSAFEALTPDSPNYQSAAASLAQAEGQLTVARLTQRAALKAQIYAVLNSSQKSQLATLKAAHEARKQQWQQFKTQNPLPSTNQPAQ